MAKSYRTILAVLLIVLVAGTAFAGKVNNTGMTFTFLEASESPTNRDVYTISYDFAVAPIGYTAAGAIFNDVGMLDNSSTMVAFGFENVVADIYENPGASFSNWASELFLAVTYDNLGEVGYVGTSPFTENEGPGTFGPATNHFDFAPGDWPLSFANPFTFRANAQWDDATGLDAGTVTSGIMYVFIDGPPVATESASMDAVKALYR